MAKMINADELIEFCDTERSMLHGHNNSVACAALRRVVEFAKENAVEVITREDFIKEAKELITAFVGSGEKTEENRIIFALVFGNLELRLFGSRDGDSE